MLDNMHSLPICSHSKLLSTIPSQPVAMIFTPKIGKIINSLTVHCNTLFENILSLMRRELYFLHFSLIIRVEEGDMFENRIGEFVAQASKVSGMQMDSLFWY